MVSLHYLKVHAYNWLRQKFCYPLFREKVILELVQCKPDASEATKSMHLCKT